MMIKSYSKQQLHTGIGIIDSQHQTFFTILQKIRERAHQQDFSISETLEELHLYTLYHFETEEKIMQEAGVPNLDEHKEIHKNFVEKVEEFRLMNIVDDQNLIQEMSNTLEDWFINHILNIDKVDLEYAKDAS